MPSAHRRYAEWTPAGMMCEAEKIGPATITLVQAIMQAKPHPEQGFRVCLASCGSPAATARPASRKKRLYQRRFKNRRITQDSGY
jgi:hypothetical protein